MRFLMVTVALALAACGGDEGREIASGTFDDGNGGRAEYSVRGDEARQTVRVKSEDGELVMRSGEGGALPGGLPLYPGAKVITNATMSDRETTGGMTMLESKDPPAALSAFYRKAAERAGWDVNSEFKTEGAQMFGGSAKNGSGFQITVQPGGDGGSTAMIVMGNE